ncbi:related to cytochrome P450 CYP2 subfamily [Ramularia collo-cygni]|uniref:Related to cytochrome P450 CYP2 subfamily n=1 Tax=Ramularia collo-cygni TaxID=112498 RepID=A0A2D3UV46_9PEZI|nr:related to cytochrome P450 CYP2 subfamily [Ramularia collo-cygni]CZT19118.1 related to cytochrome P450 CYP2 subfamily [Ramularia collo-cygni]
MSAVSFIQYGLLLVIAGCLAKLILLTRPPKGLPPGPPPLPILGNIRDMPPSGGRTWEHWAKFKELYGPIGALTTFGTTLIIISDYDLAVELLQKNSGISADRAQPTFLAEMCQWWGNTALIPYGTQHRNSRKQIASVFGSDKLLTKFNHMQDLEVRRFLLRVLKQPESLLHHIRTEIGAIILKITYGYNAATDSSDPLVELADTCVREIGEAANVGAWLVDLIPALKNLPSWFPGTSFKQTALQFKRTAYEGAVRPWKFVEAQMADGQHTPSYVSDLLERAGGKMSQEETFYAKWTALSVYLGGADTSASAIASFFLAMTWHPEIQEKAREEIARVVGSGRLPELSDRPSMPYIEAIAKESLRWHPFVPEGVPHLMTAETTLAGYRIPEGAIIIAAAWSMGHDKNIYSEPDQFNPERYLGDTPEMEPRNFVFGFGRRICPGKLLAEQSVFLTIAKVLSVFEIAGPKQGEGCPISFDPGLVSHPHHFEAAIRPRSQEHAALILAVEKEPQVKSSAEILKNITSW